MSLGGFLVCAALAGSVGAQPMLPGAKKVPGETWRNSMSMEMQGMSMPMPGGGKETCVPVGKAQEAMAAPDKDCQVYDTQAAGNKFSAKFRCTGQQKMEGSMESVAEGDRIRGTMRARSADGNEFTMKFDNTRLGKACEAIDYAGYKPPPPPQYATVDVCKGAAEKFEYTLFIGKDAHCAKSPEFKTFCARVKTPAGFLKLDTEQRKAAGLDYSAYQKTLDVSALKEPLNTSFAACGFDNSPTGVDSVRRSLLAVAESEVNWDYLLIEGDAGSGGAGAGQGGAGGGQGGAGGGQGGGGGLGGLAGTAQQQCTGRAFTGGLTSNNPKYDKACRDYGFALSRGDYDGARGNAYQKYGLAYTPTGGGAAGRATGAADARGAQAPADPNAKPAVTDVAKEALDKGKNVLRSILGR